MEEAIIEWLREVALRHQRREAWIAKEYAKVLESGGRVVSHTGGGSQDENRIFDVFTRETLAVLPDTHTAMSDAWQDNWTHDDTIWTQAFDLFGNFPQPPQKYAFFLDWEQLEAEDAIEFLKEYDANA